MTNPIQINLSICAEDPDTPDARQLLDRLSDQLTVITGASGRSSFDPDDMRMPRALFVVARNAAGEALGCGGFRPHSPGSAELKRMFSTSSSAGIGSSILWFLELQAAEMGYNALLLETRAINEAAVRFYRNKGYRRIDNFGKYAGNAEAVCFEKRLAILDPFARRSRQR